MTTGRINQIVSKCAMRYTFLNNSRIIKDKNFSLFKYIGANLGFM